MTPVCSSLKLQQNCSNCVQAVATGRRAVLGTLLVRCKMFNVCIQQHLHVVILRNYDYPSYLFEAMQFVGPLVCGRHFGTHAAHASGVRRLLQLGRHRSPAGRRERSLLGLLLPVRLPPLNDYSLLYWSLNGGLGLRATSTKLKASSSSESRCVCVCACSQLGRYVAACSPGLVLLVPFISLKRFLQYQGHLCACALISFICCGCDSLFHYICLWTGLLAKDFV